MAEVTDLSLVLGEPKLVRLHEDGQVYKLPADIPIPLMLKLDQLGEQAGGEDDEAAGRAVLALYEETLALFRVHQPELESLPLSPVQLVHLVTSVYVTGQAGPDPTKPNASTRSSSRGKGRSRSTSSSAS